MKSASYRRCLWGKKRVGLASKKTVSFSTTHRHTPHRHQATLGWVRFSSLIENPVLYNRQTTGVILECRMAPRLDGLLSVLYRGFCLLRTTFHRGGVRVALPLLGGLRYAEGSLSRKSERSALLVPREKVQGCPCETETSPTLRPLYGG